MHPEGMSVTELRVEIVRRWHRPMYHLGAAAGIHPATLSNMLRGRVVMTPAAKARVLAVLRSQGTEAPR